jgi:hypothetical protein
VVGGVVPEEGGTVVVVPAGAVVAGATVDDAPGAVVVVVCPATVGVGATVVDAPGTVVVVASAWSTVVDVPPGPSYPAAWSSLKLWWFPSGELSSLSCRRPR